jgi:hypothetical protein
MLLLRYSILLAIGIVLGASRASEAQENRIIQGRVVDAADNAPLPGAIIVAIVAIVAEQSVPVVAGSTGAFSIRVPAGPTSLTATRLGFAPDTVAVGDNQTGITFRLRATSVAIDPITVLAERGFSAASSSTIREVDIRLRPQESSQELLSLVPGVVIAQHAGGGKAEQIFARGFDADHGTDVAYRWTAPRSTWFPMRTVRATRTCTS